jgi:hypothetical protein
MPIRLFCLASHSFIAIGGQPFHQTTTPANNPRTSFASARPYQPKEKRYEVN